LLNTGGMFILKRYTGIKTVSLVHSLVFLINILLAGSYTTCPLLS
jgi:hypothetical protein